METIATDKQKEVSTVNDLTGETVYATNQISTDQPYADQPKLTQAQLLGSFIWKFKAVIGMIVIGIVLLCMIAVVESDSGKIVVGSLGGVFVIVGALIMWLSSSA